MYELPTYAARRYRLESTPVGDDGRVDLALWDHRFVDGPVVTRAEVQPDEVADVVRVMIRVADSSYGGDLHPTAIAARLAIQAVRLSGIGVDRNKVAEAFDGDHASVLVYVAEALTSLGLVMVAESEAFREAMHATDSPTWEHAAGHAVAVATKLSDASKVLLCTVDHVIDASRDEA